MSRDSFTCVPRYIPICAMMTFVLSSVCLLCERNPLSKAHTLLFNFQFAHKFRRSKYTLMKACARCLSLTHAHTQCCTQDVFTRLSCTTFSLCIRTKVCIIYIHVPIYLHVYMYVNVYEYFYVYIYLHTYTYLLYICMHEKYICVYIVVGTYFCDLGAAIRPERGHVLSFDGDLLHGGDPIT